MQQLEFDKLRAFVAVGFDYVYDSTPIAPEHHPAAVADGMWAASPGTALRGLRAAAADVVEMLQDLKGDDLIAFEKRLAENDAPSLAAMRAQRVGDVFRILSRAAIRDDDEWRIVNAVVNDMSDHSLDEASRALAQRLLGEYEKSKTID